MNREDLLITIKGLYKRSESFEEIHDKLADLIEEQKKDEVIRFMKYYFGETDVFEKSYTQFKEATK